MDWIKIERSKEKQKPIVWQLTDSLRQAIKDGRLPAGHKLPSSRTLAEQLRLSRNVVILAYEQLAVEGYIEAYAGSGNYVADGAQWNVRRKESGFGDSKKTTAIETHDQKDSIINFRPGIPALDLFPRRLWGQLAQQTLKSINEAELSYGHPAGSLPLRQLLRRHLSLYRGVQCNVEQIVITSGAAQAFDLLARLLASMVKEIIVEDPMTRAIYLNFGKVGLKVLPIEVDEQGMRTEILPERKSARGIFVTPSHQFPLGGVLPIQRRLELVRFAQNTNSYILEDDYDSEFRHRGSPLPALQELAPDRVIYVGTFSKMLFPGLRLGYVVLPPSLIDEFLSRKHVHDLGCPITNQLILAHFIKAGHLQRHILQMKKVYAKRRMTLMNSLDDQFGNKAKILGDATGMHLIAEFPGHRFTPQQVSRIERGGVRIYPVEDHAIAPGRHSHRLIFGYGNLSPEKIEAGIKLLASLLSH